MIPEHHLIQCYPQRVNIALGVGHELARELLGRHVRHRPLPAFLLFQFRRQLRHPKVTVLVQFALYQDIGRLDILMNDPRMVQVNVPFGQLEEQIIDFMLPQQSSFILFLKIGQTASLTVLLEDIKMPLRLQMLLVGINEVGGLGDVLDYLELLEDLLAGFGAL